MVTFLTWGRVDVFFLCTVLIWGFDIFRTSLFPIVFPFDLDFNFVSFAELAFFNRGGVTEIESLFVFADFPFAIAFVFLLLFFVSAMMISLLRKNGRLICFVNTVSFVHDHFLHLHQNDVTFFAIYIDLSSQFVCRPQLIDVDR